MSVVQEHDVPSAATAELPSGGDASRRVVVQGAEGVPSSRLQRLMSTGVSQYLAHRIQYVGRTGVAGIALLVFAVAFFLGANLAMKSSVEELRANVDSARASRSSGASPEEVRAAAIRTLVTALPERSALPAITGKIVAEADAAGIALERGNYDFTVTHSGRLVRARMTFPVHGRYPDIRRFIDSTLAAVPGAAVDGLRLERKDIGAGEIDADIRFAVYVRGAP